MAKKYSLIIIGNSGQTVRPLTVSIAQLLLVLTVLVLGIAAIGLSFYDYRSIHRMMAEKQDMQATLNQQQEEIGQQRLQIQSFANEINTLKDQLVKLDQFEEKIRVIANLDPKYAEENLFGVGGAALEDLDPQLAMTGENDAMVREMHQQIDELDAASRSQEKRFNALLDNLNGQQNLLASTPAIRPTVGWVTSRFGYRVSPFTGRKELHKGIDIAYREGTAILATANGVVSFVGRKGTLGNILVIDHGHGLVTRYAHLNKALKKRGERVKRGDIVAEMGNSGRSTGPHLHYEVHLNGVPVNPARYILD
ncbi:MAG: metalloendopeptidase [Deltaproteobacteria bacterium]|nr:MAG: metalloendopeptidase [Deltaproteobacteria bacterium]